MAQPISFHVAPRSPREALHARVESAPEDHAEAVLAAYDLLQVLHDRGLLGTVRSALVAGDTLLEAVVDQASTPEAIRGIRNLLFLSGALGRIEPAWLQGLLQAIPDALAQSTRPRDEQGLWTLFRRAQSKDSLRGLAVAVDLLESLGRQLHALEAAAPITPSDR
jgi:uncharacterized protein YjgD (DUF1641 family)